MSRPACRPFPAAGVGCRSRPTDRCIARSAAPRRRGAAGPFGSARPEAGSAGVEDRDGLTASLSIVADCGTGNLRRHQPRVDVLSIVQDTSGSRKTQAQQAYQELSRAAHLGVDRSWLWSHPARFEGWRRGLADADPIPREPARDCDRSRSQRRGVIPVRARLPRAFKVPPAALYVPF